MSAVNAPQTDMYTQFCIISSLFNSLTALTFYFSQVLQTALKLRGNVGNAIFLLLKGMPFPTSGYGHGYVTSLNFWK